MKNDPEYKRQWYLRNRERIKAERLTNPVTEEQRALKAQYDKERRKIKGMSFVVMINYVQNFLNVEQPTANPAGEEN